MPKPTPKPTPSMWQRTTKYWVSKTAIDWPTYKTIFKDTLAPTIGLAANQAIPWSHVFGTLGFLVPMASIISRPSPPRAEFLWMWVTNILGSCASAAVTALAFFCVIKAREQYGGPIVDPSDVPYNAVASTVAAIWLAVQVYVASAVRYNYPWTTWMVSACLIFANYGMVYVVEFPDMTAAFSFLRQLLFAHLVGFGISAGVSLLVFPTNSRERFYKTVSACTGEIRMALRTNIELMERTVRSTDSSVPPELDAAREQHKVKLDSLQTKLAVQVGDAQNEIARSMLTPVGLRNLTHLLEEIIIPLAGLCRVPDVMGRTFPDNDGKEGGRNRSLEQYRELLGSVVEPFSRASAVADKGLQCSETITRLDIPARSLKGTEADKEAPIQQLQCEMDRLVESKTDLLKAWYAQRGGSDSDSIAKTGYSPEEYDQSRGNLHMLLYTELLLWSICHRVQKLLVWAEEIKTSRTSRRKQMIVPVWAKSKALASTFSQWMGAQEESLSSRHNAHKRTKQRRPFSPIRTLWTFTLRLIQSSTSFFASPASGFAFRVTSATMSIAIVAYLPSCQKFYIKEHLVWAQYAVSYAMQGTAGQGVRALVFRMGGTIVAVCLAWISWYIVVGIPAGVLVFYWLSIHFPMYIMAVRPRYSTVGSVSAFALTTVLGNALQPNGTGQATIILGAVRLAALGGGCLLATIWTLFPFPVSDHDGARRSLGACLACLAEYHAGFHEIVRIRLGEGLTQESPNSRARELEDAHSRLLAKCNSHLQALHSRLGLAKWNILTDGALFSHSHYERAYEKIDNLIRNMQLITFATSVFIDFIDARPLSSPNCAHNWLVDFRNLFDATQHDGLGVATLLGLLSHSVRNGTSLPPKLILPGPEKLWSYFDEPKMVAQQVRRVDDSGAATFALMRIGTKGVYKDLGELLEVVREMVGEFDFICGFAVDEEE